MSDFNFQPLVAPQINHEPRVLAAAFGDGYEQRVGDGINTDAETYQLQFTDTSARIQTIEAFFKLKNGVTSFTWTPWIGAAEIRVVCKRWDRTRIASNVETISTEFVHVFE